MFVCTSVQDELKPIMDQHDPSLHAEEGPEHATGIGTQVSERLNSIVPWHPESAELLHLNFQSIGVVSRYRDTQLQLTENVCDL